MPVVWPVHPRTHAPLRSIGRLDSLAQRVKLIDPVCYLEMVQLEKFSAVIATDSGGIQKQAFFHEIPCVTIRRETEWTKLVDLGWNRPVAHDSAVTVADVMESAVGIRAAANPYGKVDEATKIADHLSAYATIQ